MSIHAKIGILVMLLAASFSYVRADERMYRCEFGIEGGCGYYIGDATSLPFQNVREMYGANFRCRFDQRWNIQVQGIAHRIVGPYPNSDQKWTNQLINVDVAAEFNFFRFGAKSYDIRVKPLTPYIMLGVGASVHSQFSKVAAYIPFGVGLKWKFAERFNLQLLLQNNLFFADNLEYDRNANSNNELLKKSYHNPNGLNGANVFNNDITSTISLGLTIEFAKDKKICRACPN